MQSVIPLEPEFESLTERLLEIARIRSADALLRHVVDRLAERPHIGLARIWLVTPCDHRRGCAFEARCREAKVCLHLAASAGRSRGGAADWGRLDGAFARVPLGVGNVGLVAARGRQVVVNDAAPDFNSFLHPAWARTEGVRGFNGQPIVHGDELLGVLAVFTRIPVPAQSPVWLRIFADHIAAALANARAFEEIGRLKRQLELENRYLREQVDEARSLGGILGRSRPVRRLLKEIAVVAPTDATALVLGESGTGKELVAHEIHRQSPRAERALIRVNCASVPHELFESEFFGHAKGAFTGAVRDRAGRFEAADQGTLFLDEVGEIPLALQGKFLRVLQERQYERVGEERTRSVDVRIIAATNRDLEAEVAAGRFREDLYYRLHVFPIAVPSLRERLEDVPLLVGHFVAQAARRLRLAEPHVSPACLAELSRYAWPGNVRELQNAVERAVILAQGGDLVFQLGRSRLTPWSEGKPERPTDPSVRTDAEVREEERRNLLAALEQCRWKIEGTGGTAERLGVKPSTLKSRIKALGLTKPPRGRAPPG